MPIFMNRSRIRRLVRYGDLKDAIVPTNAEIRAALVPKLDRLFRKNERALFSSEGKTGGSVWTPLSDNPEGKGYKSRKDRLFTRASAYRESIRRARGGKRPRPLVNKRLQFYGDLMQSLTREGDMHIARLANLGDRSSIVELGTLDPVGSYHWAGNEKLPIRDPIKHTAEQKQEYADVVTNWMRPRFERVIRALRAASKARA